MQYFKVLPNYDNYRVFSPSNRILIANELYTQKELNKLGLFLEQSKYFKPINISKNKTYWLFGARFESKS